MGEILDRSQKSEVRSQESGDRSQKLEDRTNLVVILRTSDTRLSTNDEKNKSKIETSELTSVTSCHGKQKVLNLIKARVQGSIVEPVIAVVILVITMAMAFTILTRTNITPIVQAKNRANELISMELFQTINESDFLDKEEQIGAFRIVKKVELVQNKNAVNIIVQVFDLKQKEIMKKQIIIANRTLLSNEE